MQTVSDLLLLVLLGAACDSDAPPPAPAVPIASAPPVADAAVPDARIAADAMPDAGVSRPVGTGRRHVLDCKLESGDATELAFSKYRFHGVVPWVGLEEPLVSRCCVLPTAAILCLVTEQAWLDLPLGGGQTLRTKNVVEHARLFEPGAAAPWRDFIVSAFAGGEMSEPNANAHKPFLAARLETDSKSFLVVGVKDAACAPDAKLPCDAFIAEVGGCGGYRKKLAPLKAKFCEGRGDYVWSGARFSR